MKTPCIEWQGYKNRQGYGWRKRPGTRQNVFAHRLAWEVAHGDPGELCVLHKCDNPACINVEHLFLGTRADNQEDMRQKGRARKPTYCRDKMRELIASGMTQTAIAALMGCDKSTVSKAVNST